MTYTAVVGVGNVLMGDEGVGIWVAEELRRTKLPEEVVVFDGGIALLDLLGEVEGFDRLVIVDAMWGDGPPGAIYRLGRDELRSGGTGFSLHEMGVVGALEVGRLTYRVPEEVVLIGIEPERIGPGMELSRTLQKRLPDIVRAVMREVKRREDDNLRTQAYRRSRKFPPREGVHLSLRGVSGGVQERGRGTDGRTCRGFDPSGQGGNWEGSDRFPVQQGPRGLPAMVLPASAQTQPGGSGGFVRDRGAGSGQDGGPAGLPRQQHLLQRGDAGALAL
ncbi:MAG TPA: hydrogenase maturation protease [Candidatus Latescibacteria bacterium]|nr:hydrogenase maturation protease [Candidatus Latescibacterota bacterium]